MTADFSSSQRDQRFVLPVFPQCRGLLPEQAGTTEVLRRGLNHRACLKGTPAKQSPGFPQHCNPEFATNSTSPRIDNRKRNRVKAPRRGEAPTREIR